ncbi:hypothetical protein Acr_00g0041910 [Actinidia rufa]|uniref:Uncharacterized protein n=1 Tax=Actinidia rufa TaxID=165716 RepID=A0A7J0DI61_9ERIC|nr:hypothetical protein Acr_00g0041910 [Actinidia rufa]
MVLHSIFESSTSEERWITQINKILEKEVRVDIDHPVSIFRVPATLSIYKPEAYVPQLIGLGPYHHFQPQLYEMERYKLAAASRLQKQFNSFEFKYLVAKLNVVERYVRACYHKYLDIEGDTLAKLAHGSIIGDIVMLENQIPIFVLSEILSIQYSLPDVVNNMLPTMLMSFCNAISPLKLEDLALSQVSAHSHVLDLLYHLVAPEFVGPNEANALFGKMEDESFTKTTSADSSKEIKKISNPKKGDSGEEKKTPIVEEIMIPSVSQLASVGVEFCPTVDGKIGSITFRPELRETLPSKLMNGIIDTVEDAKLLREKKIIVNCLRSDPDVVQLFNGMSKAVRLTNVPFLDKTIQDVNKYYNNAWQFIAAQNSSTPRVAVLQIDMYRAGTWISINAF